MHFLFASAVFLKLLHVVEEFKYFNSCISFIFILFFLIPNKKYTYVVTIIHTTLFLFIILFIFNCPNRFFSFSSHIKQLFYTIK